MDEQRPNLSVDVESLALIDVSMEDDDLLSSPAAKDATFNFVGSPSTAVRKSRSSFSPESTEKSPSNADEKQNNGTSSAARGEHPSLCEDDDKPNKKRRAGQYNLRKSLAWDKAFFTNEGVLNPTELSLVNKTYKKANEALMPGIEEEGSVRCSLDSDTSVENDYNFEVLEENLFGQPYESTDSETFSTQSHSLTPSSAKLLVTEKKNTVKKVAKTPDKKALHSFKESHPIRKELQKTSLLKDISSKTASITNKRRKFLHGNDESANETRVSTQKSSILKTNRISDRLSPNSCRSASQTSCRSASQTSSISGSAKYPASTPHFELQKEVALGTDLKSIRVLNELPINNSESIVASHSSFQQSIPPTDPAVARDSAYLQLEKQNPVSGTISSSNSGCAQPLKPSGLRMPSPRIGFFDTDKFIRPPSQISSGTTCLLPPNMPKGPSAVHQASRLKPLGAPLSYKSAAPSSIPIATLRPESALLTSATSLRAPDPSYKGALPTLRSESALENTTSVPANPHSQIKPNLEHSSLASLAQQKFGYSRAREAYCNQRSVEKLHTAANRKEASVAVETETSTHGNGEKISDDSMFQVAARQTSSNVNSLPVNSSVQNSADPFSEEWISALENVGEKTLSRNGCK